MHRCERDGGLGVRVRVGPRRVHFDYPPRNYLLRVGEFCVPRVQIYVLLLILTFTQFCSMNLRSLFLQPQFVIFIL